MVIMPKKHAMLIWKVSWCSMISALYAIYQQHYSLCIVPAGVLITSLNYWRHPIYGWRRNCDISYVCASVIYQSIIAYNMKYAIPYYLCTGVAIAFYPIGRAITNKWHATYAHCAIHIIANIANIILYSAYN